MMLGLTVFPKKFNNEHRDRLPFIISHNVLARTQEPSRFHIFKSNCVNLLKSLVFLADSSYFCNKIKSKY